MTFNGRHMLTNTKEEKKMTFGWGKVAAFVGSALFGTAGICSAA